MHPQSTGARARGRAVRRSVATLCVLLMAALPSAATAQPTADAAHVDAVGIRIDNGEVVAPQHPAAATAGDLSAAAVLERARASQAAADAGTSERVDGDLDGDGLPDLLVTGVNPDKTLRVSGRRGLDGTTLWSVDVPGRTVLPAKIGAAAAGGAYVYQLVDWQNPWRFTAIDATGAVAWQREFTQRTTPAYIRGVRDFWVADTVGTTATDLVVVLETFASTPAGRTTTAEIEVFDGATGALAWTYTDSSVGGDHRPYPLGDVDGDGRSDVGVGEYRSGAEGSLTLLSGRTGAPLWRNPRISTGGPLQSAGDLDGDGRDEILVSYVRQDGSRARHATAVVDGLLGIAEFTVDAIGYRLGDIDDDGDDELGALGARREGDTVTAWLSVLGADGGEVRRYEMARVVVPDETLSGYVRRAGDVDADGVTDGEIGLRAHSSSGELVWSDESVVGGRTGRPLWDGVTSQPVLISIDGSGDDYLDFDAPFFAQQTSVTPFDGATGTPLWNVEFPARFGLVGITDVDGDGGGDLVLGRGKATTVLRSRDGTTLWTD